MSCFREPILTAISTVLALAALVVASLPHSPWLKTKGDSDVEVSLWCTRTPAVSWKCSKGNYHDLGHDDNDTEVAATKAGILLAAISLLIVLFALCCRKKAVVVSCAWLAVLWSAVALGCFYRVREHFNEDEDNYKWQWGYGMVILGFFFSLVSGVFSLCWNPGMREGYYQLA